MAPFAIRKIGDPVLNQRALEITDIDGMDEDRAAKLIMAARAPMIARLEQGG